MTKQEIQRRKEHARMLYLNEHLTFEEIADRAGLSRQTIGKTAKEEKWEEMKVCLTLTREEQIKSLYRQIAEINRNITGREEGKRFPTPSETDTIVKLSSAIKKMETEVGIDVIVSVAGLLLNLVRKIDLDEAKKVTEWFDILIKERL